MLVVVIYIYIYNLHIPSIYINIPSKSPFYFRYIPIPSLLNPIKSPYTPIPSPWNSHEQLTSQGTDRSWLPVVSPLRPTAAARASVSAWWPWGAGRSGVGRPWAAGGPENSRLSTWKSGEKWRNMEGKSTETWQIGSNWEHLEMTNWSLELRKMECGPSRLGVRPRLDEDEMEEKENRHLLDE